jgi:hypothetical protein
MRLPLLAAALGLLLTCAAVFAQSTDQQQGSPPGAPGDQSGQDVFDTSTFDQSVQQSRQAEQSAKLEVLFGGQFLSDNTLYATTDFNGYAVGGSFTGKAFTKVSVPNYGVLYIAYNFTHNIYQGVGGSAPGGAGSYLSQPLGDVLAADFELAEFYASFDIARVVFLRLGNQLISWGPSAIWTPVDFINLQKVNPLSPFDLRIGKPGLRVHVPLGISNVFLFGDFSGTVSANPSPPPALQVNDPVQTTNLGARWDITALGFELALSGYWGASIQNKYGFDFSGQALGFDVYGECAAGFAQGSYPFTWASSLGFQRTMGELRYWTLQGEVFYNDAGTADTSLYPLQVSNGTFAPFYVGKAYAYLGLTRVHLFVDGVSGTLAGFVNFSDGSYLARLSSTIDVPKLVPFTVALSYAGGGSGKEFTYFIGDRSISLDVQVRISF